MPAEWEPHAATWMAWPHNRADWPGKLEAVEWVVAEVARHLSRDERVEILVHETGARPRVRRLLADAGAELDRIRLHTVPTDRSWTRDTVPTFIKARKGSGVDECAVVDWRFNGWARYRNWRRDDAVGEWLANKLRLPRFVPLRPESGRAASRAASRAVSLAGSSHAAASDGKRSGRAAFRAASLAGSSHAAASDGTRSSRAAPEGSSHRAAFRSVASSRAASRRGDSERRGVSPAERVVLEGGAIDVNGAGLLLTTEECLLSPVQARNPGVPRRQMETILAEYLGIEKVLWLGRGIAGDDTHGHVDDLARFVGPRTVVTVVEENAGDPNHRPLAGNLARLRRMTDQRGRRLKVETLPMPAPLIFKGRHLPASYANFYIANRKVLVPTFNDPHDRVALETLARLFPRRQVIGIHAVDLVWGLGTIHCMTQQQPA